MEPKDNEIYSTTWWGTSTENGFGNIYNQYQKQ